MELATMIQTFRNQIFENKISSAMGSLGEIFGELIKIARDKENTASGIVSKVVLHLEAGLQNKDYLLLADILTYEISPLVEAHKGGDDR
jgi:hypothetical protein